MFGLVFHVANSVAILKAAQEYQRRFNQTCKDYPEYAAKLIADRKKRQDEELQHQRNLEVARESRPLNFWGYR